MSINYQSPNQLIYQSIHRSLKPSSNQRIDQSKDITVLSLSVCLCIFLTSLSIYNVIYNCFHIYTHTLKLQSACSSAITVAHPSKWFPGTWNAHILCFGFGVALDSFPFPFVGLLAVVTSAVDAHSLSTYLQVNA